MVWEHGLFAVTLKHHPLSGQLEFEAAQSALGLGRRGTARAIARAFPVADCDGVMDAQPYDSCRD